MTDDEWNAWNELRRLGAEVIYVEDEPALDLSTIPLRGRAGEIRIRVARFVDAISRVVAPRSECNRRVCLQPGGRLVLVVTRDARARRN